MVKAFFRDTLITLLLTIVVFFVVQNTIQVSIVNGSSMEPDLHSGQRLIVNKVAYYLGDPQRGDIIIFRPPPNPLSTPYIKRIVGLPGETVEVKSGVVYVNGKPLDEPYIKEKANYSRPAEKIAADNYYVLGDNRNNTNDSHIWGPVPRENIIGKASLSIWPPEVWGLAPNYGFEAP